jgi:signal transduction histidine kinase
MKNSRQKVNYDDLDKAELIQRLKKTEKNLLLKNKDAERIKTSFLSNISHEVRTPMNAIMGFSDLLKDENISREERDFFINSITSSSEKLLSIIDNIIEAAQIESNQIKKKDEGCPINELLENIYNSYIDSQKFKDKKHISLELKLNSDNNLYIITDPRILSRIFNNLIDNAYKFTEEGSIEFGYDLINGSTIQFFVSDTGIGIPRDKCKIIFDHFRQVDDGFSKKHGGLGMGLTISKKLAQLINGKLEIISSPGIGTNLSLSLPIKTVTSIEPKNTPITPVKHPAWLNQMFGKPKLQTVECESPNLHFFSSRQNFSA